MGKPQPSATAIRRKIREFALTRDLAPERVELAVANFVLLQVMLSSQELNELEFYLKGGHATEIRLGLAESRVTKDLDLSFRVSRSSIRQTIESMLGQSWGPFTVRSVREVHSGNPTNISEDEKLLRYFIHIGIGKSSWRRVTLEASPIQEFSWKFEYLSLPSDIGSLLGSLSKSKVAAVPTIQIEQQMAEKLHAVTAPGSQRGHDIFDLFIYASNHEVNTRELSRLTKKVFLRRAAHTIPSVIIPNDLLRAEFDRQVGKIADAPNFDIGIMLVNELLATINLDR